MGWFGGKHPYFWVDTHVSFPGCKPVRWALESPLQHLLNSPLPGWSYITLRFDRSFWNVFVQRSEVEVACVFWGKQMMIQKIPKMESIDDDDDDDIF